ncbi:hypothetical protein AVEN_209695-1 [Araneus ventricosus]|uniref:Uncharacterized protein n=1 Tax=Araneus ventricosus TaxID=182803 RepID=A0A4Y2W8I4_ARAVE|nr:hypothetical protein AVEN_209695-1 [Araneus ventricosus]
MAVVSYYFTIVTSDMSAKQIFTSPFFRMLSSFFPHVHTQRPPPCSDEFFTPERIRGSESSKGTTGSDSDQKERIREIGFVMNPGNRIRESELDSL